MYEVVCEFEIQVCATLNRKGLNWIVQSESFQYHVLRVVYNKIICLSEGKKNCNYTTK